MLGVSRPRAQPDARPNTKPGLGITINEQAVKKHPFQQEIVLREFNRDGAVTDW